MSRSGREEHQLVGRDIESLRCLGAGWRRLAGAHSGGPQGAVAHACGEGPRMLAVPRSPLHRLHEPSALAGLEVLAAPPTRPTTEPR